MEKAKPTIGLFAGIFDREGRILLKKIEEGVYGGKYDLPGGAIYLEDAKNALDERLIGEALRKRVLAETGLEINIQPMPAMYPAVIKGGDDIAFAIIVGIQNKKPEKGKFFSVEEVIDMAEEGALLSGKKRMFRMILRIFVSRDCPNEKYRIDAAEVLKKMHP